MDLNFNQKVNADTPTMYAAVATPKGIQGWWCQNSEVADKVGGIHTMNFVKDGKPVVMKFKVDEMIPNQRVAWTCLDNSDPTWIGTKLTFELSENGDLNFTHGNFDEKWRGAPPVEMTAEGWKHFMSSLKSYCETGQGQPW